MSSSFQNWPAYNRSQSVEKEYFTHFLSELTQREQAPNVGRPKANLGELAFCCALKVYSGFSTRRNNTEIVDAFNEGLISRPHSYNTIIDYFKKPELTPLLHELIAMSAAPMQSVEETFAIDSSGFRTTLFTEYMGFRLRIKHPHEWIKAHICCGVKTNIVSAVDVTTNLGGDSPHFIPLMNRTASLGFSIKEILADRAYLARENLEAATKLGAIPYIPFKSDSQGRARGHYPTWKKMYPHFQGSQDDFKWHYNSRNNVESTFHMVKSKFGDNIRNKNSTARINELLCKFLCHNIVVSVHELHELGIVPQFCPESLLSARQLEAKR